MSVKFTEAETRNLKYYKSQISAIKKARRLRQEENDRKAALARRVDEQAKAARLSRDSRIRKAVLAFAANAKANNIAFQAPEWGVQRKEAFKLVVQEENSWRTEIVQIYTTRDGFQWD